MCWSPTSLGICDILFCLLLSLVKSSFWCSPLSSRLWIWDTLPYGAVHKYNSYSQHGQVWNSEITPNLKTETVPAGDDLCKAVPQYDRERLPDAHGLVDIESSFSKLVGNKLAAAFDIKFLRIVAHVFLGKQQPTLSCSLCYP